MQYPTINTSKMSEESRKLGLIGLTAIVFSSMIGGGIYAIPQNMAAGAGLGATIISWMISGFGVLFLVLTFKTLSDLRPELNSGIYQYAKESFGNYIGFNVAWGYWLCAAMGNVAFAVMLNDSLGFFFPVLLNYGWQTWLLSSVLIWCMFGIVASGIKEASIINAVVSILKFTSLTFIIVILLLFFKTDNLTWDFWGKDLGLGSVTQQVRSTMLVTLWCFIGVEGAVVVSGRARHRKDIGRAGVIGFILALFLYLMLSILSYGILRQPELALLPNPSVPYVLEAAVGHWGAIFVLISIIFSILGGWIAWTILCAEVPYTSAKANILPRVFGKENKHESPINSLFASSLLMQFFIFIVVLSEHVYLAAIEIAGVMILPSYLFSGLFLIKESYTPAELQKGLYSKVYLRIIGFITTAYCIWLIYAGGLELFYFTSIAYLIGIGFYIKGRMDHRNEGEVVFTHREKIYAAVIFFAALSCIGLLISGYNPL